MDAVDNDTHNLKSLPFWWEGTELVKNMASNSGELSDQADVVVIGAGLSGLAAARTLANAGRSVVVLDAGRPGGGASSRNGAMLGRYLKHSFSEMMNSRGVDVATRYFRELDEIYKAAIERIAGLDADCGLRERGRVVGAISIRHRDRLFREWELRSKHVGEAVAFIDGPDNDELPTDRYVGGIHIIQNAAVHPGRYTLALLRAAVTAGATVIGNTAVTHVEDDGDTHIVATERGKIRARQVLVTTNGYTGKSQGWFHRRLSPIDAYMIATEPLGVRPFGGDRELTRTYHDNRKNSNYYQLSEDGRLIFGGRTGLIHLLGQRYCRKAPRRNALLLSAAGSRPHNACLER
jgi:glycine/D-amino acid oxidase-like deaminating enzyme